MKVLARVVLPIFLFFSVTNICFSRKTGELPELMQPEMMVVKGGRLFVLDGIKVHVYLLEGLVHQNSFGKRGNGPGEFTSDFLNRLTMQVNDSGVFLCNLSKMALFSHTGKLLMEKNLPFITTQIVPLADGYVITRYVRGEEGINSLSVQLCSGDLQKIRTLYARKDIALRRSGRLDCPNEQIFVRTGNSSIYILDQKPGTDVQVFDLKGEKKTDIKIPVTPIKMPETYKNEVLEWTRTATTQMESFKARSGLTMDDIRRMVFFHRMLPGIRHFFLDGQNLLAETYEKKNGCNRFVSFDSNGTLLKQTYLTDSEPGRVKMTPYAAYAFTDGYYFYLRDNQELEVWELYCEKF